MSVQHNGSNTLENKISSLDFTLIAAPLGATLSGENNQTLSFPFLGQGVKIRIVCSLPCRVIS